MAVEGGRGGERGRGIERGESEGCDSAWLEGVKLDNRLEMLRGRHNSELLLLLVLVVVVLVLVAEADLGDRGGRAMAARRRAVLGV
jgi:hypothetical protein